MHRGDRGSTLRKALIVSGAWIAVSVVFGMVVGTLGRWESAGEYFGVYLTEKSLSIDNIFVFAILFRAFAVPVAYQRRVLFYGVFGALASVSALIAVGASLVDHFGWILYILGRPPDHLGGPHGAGNELIDPDRNLAIRFLRRVLPVTPDFKGQSFVSPVNGVLMVTPLLLALLAIEVTDLVFAHGLDSRRVRDYERRLRDLHGERLRCARPAGRSISSWSVPWIASPTSTSASPHSWSSSAAKCCSSPF